MMSTQHQKSDRKLEDLSFDVAGYHDGRYIGPSEISPPIDLLLGAAPEDTRPSSFDPAAAHTRLKALVAACGGAADRSPFNKHKEQLLSDLSPPYALFRFVKAHPELVASLRVHEALKDRARKIPKAKTALLCVHCKMKPSSAQERSSCSDWTIWLEQAEHENIEAENFVTWAMKRNFKDCRDEVRARRDAVKTSDGESTVPTRRRLHFNLRETELGASVTLRGRHFTVSKAVLEEVIAMIEQVAPEETLNMDDDNNLGDAHE